MTDLIKLHPEVDSSKVKQYLKKNHNVIGDNIASFEKEIGNLQPNPVLVAMGWETFRILKKHLGRKYRIARIKHFSCFISKEVYREEVLKTLDRF